ncbi:DUF3429 domain-containing protein [Arenibacterium sp. CAU 1754]
MRSIPRAPLVLGLAGLIPFVWGALVSGGLVWAHMGTPGQDGYPLIVLSDGPKILISYGTVILSFMSGVLWGFAARGDPGRVWPYLLSVLPALWAFFNGGSVADQLGHLTQGFLGLLLLDWLYVRQRLAPDWWLWLRVPLTVVVILCLTVGLVTP